MNAKRMRYLIEASLIGAIYFILTVIPGLSAISFGPVQIRISEALTVLPFLSPAAIPGLTVGCLLSNMLSPMPWDMLIGTSATLLAALCTYWLGRRKLSEFLAPLPPILFNAVIVGLELKYFFAPDVPLYTHMLFVAAGESVACYVLGIPLLKTMKKFYYKK